MFTCFYLQGLCMCWFLLPKTIFYQFFAELTTCYPSISSAHVTGFLSFPNHPLHHRPADHTRHSSLTLNSSPFLYRALIPLQLPVRCLPVRCLSPTLGRKLQESRDCIENMPVIVSQCQAHSRRSLDIGGVETGSLQE